jgi:hypothetical protein
MSGGAVLKLTELEPGTPEYDGARAWQDAHGDKPQRLNPNDFSPSDLASLPRGRSIAYLTSLWGGYRTQLQTPDGSVHDVDLSPWSGRDPERTCVSITFRYVNPARVGTRRSQ